MDRVPYTVMVMTKTATPKTATCRRAGCHATLRSARSVAAGIGPVCARKEREEAAARQARHEAEIAAAVASVEMLTEFKDQAAAASKAEQILLDGALVPTQFPGAYLAKASAGDDTYLVDTGAVSGVKTCTCRAGARLGRCTHLVAAFAADLLTTTHDLAA